MRFSVHTGVLILVWAEQKRIITGADLLGRLLRGIVMKDPKT
jgi:hypothetical protein